MMRPMISALLLATLWFPVGASPAWACSCAISEPEEQADAARVVFTGRARDVTQTQTNVTVRFRVTTVYKGTVDRHVKVVTASDSAACGCSFKDGKRYTVFGTSKREPISTNLCSGTNRGSIDPDEYGLPDGSRP